MRFQIITQSLVDSADFPFPWNKEIVFTIRRSGVAGFRRREQGRMLPHLLSGLKSVAAAPGVSVDGITGLVESAVSAMDISSIGLQELLDPDAEGAAEFLIEQVLMKGEPLVDLDTDEPITTYTPAVGLEIFAQLPEAVSWVIKKAREVEARYQENLKAAEGNSEASSATSTAADA